VFKSKFHWRLSKPNAKPSLKEDFLSFNISIMVCSKYTVSIIVLKWIEREYLIHFQWKETSVKTLEDLNNLFNRFRIASGLDKKEPEVQAASLLNLMGEDAIELFNTFNLSDKDA